MHPSLDPTKPLCRQHISPIISLFIHNNTVAPVIEVAHLLVLDRLIHITQIVVQCTMITMDTEDWATFLCTKDTETFPITGDRLCITIQVGVEVVLQEDPAEK